MENYINILYAIQLFEVLFKCVRSEPSMDFTVDSAQPFDKAILAFPKGGFLNYSLLALTGRNTILHLCSQLRYLECQTSTCNGETFEN